jgi:hypothetical protein
MRINKGTNIMAVKTKQSANLFSTAATLEVSPKKGKVDNKEKIKIEGLEDYAMVDSLEKNLKAIKETLKGKVNGQMKEIFTRQNNKRPENFRGIQNKASASCEMRKRTIASALTEEEVEALEADGVPVGSEVSVPSRFIINPDFMMDQALLQKISDAMRKVPGLPENFIVMQPEQSTRVVTDETLDKVCEKGLIKKHFDKVATLAIKAKLETELDIEKVLESVREMVQ